MAALSFYINTTAMKSKKIAVLYGAGKESLLSLHLLRWQEPKAQITLIFFDYGQKAFINEWKSICYYAKLYNCQPVRLQVTLNIPNGISQGVGKDTHVYMRNSVFISMAVNMCLSEKIGTLLVPFTKPFAGEYSDSYTNYLNDFKKHITRLYPKFNIINNIGHVYSSETHSELLRYKVDLKFVWSCTTYSEDFIHCGKCGKCADFKKSYRIKDHDRNLYLNQIQMR